MELSLYTAVYLFTNAFDTYLTYSFMKIFFKNNDMNKKAALFFYSFFYIATSIVYLFFSTAALNMISSLLVTFLITLCYKSKISKKIIVTVLNYLTLCTSEAIVAFTIGLSNIDPLQNTYYGDSFSLIMVELLAFIFIKIIGKFKDLSSDNPMPWSFLIAAVLIPVISVFFEIQLFMQDNVSNIVYALSLICVIILNFTIFYLYDSFTKAFNEKIQMEMIKQEIDYYHKQADLIQESSEGLKQIRHDMKNHIIVIEELAKTQDNDKILDYISNLYDKLGQAKVFSDTGIIAIDSVLNYKLTQAEKKGIDVTSEITIPNNLEFQSNDFVAILGNLLDNAIEATSKLNDNKYIKLHIKYNKGTVFIAVKNSFDGKLNIVGNEYKTTKDSDSLHGIGMKSIETTIKQYNGEMKVSHTNNEFLVKIILFS